MRRRFLPLLAICLAGCAPRQGDLPFTVSWTEGRCVGCQVAENLEGVRFLSRKEAWGIGFGYPPGPPSAGNYILVHTTDGGRTWKELAQTTQYAGPPSFWFADSTHGWFGCWNVPCAVAETKLFRTSDAGEHWEREPRLARTQT